MTPQDAFSALDTAVRSIAHDARLTAARLKEAGRPWTRGGCATFAEGVRRWLGPEAVIVGVCERGDRQIDHVAVVWRGIYFDALGARDESDFLFDMENRALFRVPTLVTIDDAATIRNVDFVPTLAKAVEAALTARLNPRPSLSALARLMPG